ncbi:MAG TPA: hypothetical protein VKA84_27910 [Gemmatimonadaceae bacterium]|nr:hypothetical protein [Gemmatimonadaceae bacterium]
MESIFWLVLAALALWWLFTRLPRRRRRGESPPTAYDGSPTNSDPSSIAPHGDGSP